MATSWRSSSSLRPSSFSSTKPFSLCGAAQASSFRFPASGWQRILPFVSSLRAAIYNPLQPQEITIDDLNARSFREQMKLGS